METSKQLEWDDTIYGMLRYNSIPYVAVKTLSIISGISATVLTYEETLKYFEIKYNDKILIFDCDGKVTASLKSRMNHIEDRKLIKNLAISEVNPIA